MIPFSFIHAADLHLDTPFAGLSQLPDEHSRIHEELKEATFRAFDNVVDLCIRREADFLLVAGDVYDSSQRSLRGQIRFREGLRRLREAGIHAYISHGNHDPLDGWLDSISMPEGVHVFGDKLTSVVHEKDGHPVARIHGISYPTRRIGASFGRGFKREGNEKFQIGLFHCHMGANPWHQEYAPRTVAELTEADLDYWALGHIHDFTIYHHHRPFIAHAGNTQGRHMQEKGPRGVLHVQVDDDGRLNSKPEFVHVDAIRWLSQEISIVGVETMDALLELVDAAMAEAAVQADGRPAVVRLSITGYGPLHPALARSHAQEDLASHIRDTGTANDPFIWLERLEVNTIPDIDIASRREAEDFLGDLLKMVEHIRHSPEEQKELSKSLSGIFDHARAGKLLPELDEDQMQVILSEAEEKCIELLMQGED